MKFLLKVLFIIYISFILLPIANRMVAQAEARTLYPVISKLSPSPDGRYILFEADLLDTGIDELYILDLLTKQVYQIAEPNIQGLDPAWSPDGSVIAFTKVTEDIGVVIYLVNPDGTNLRRLTCERAHSPVWSPDGRYLAISVHREGDFESFDDILIIDREGKDVAWLITSPRDDWPVAWSPDGSYILFMNREEAKYNSLWKANIDLTKPFPAEHTGIFRLSEPPSSVRSASISPDGSHIVLSFYNKPGIWIMNADGTGNTLIFPGRDKFDVDTVAWCPVINKIAFVGTEFQEYNKVEGYLGPDNIYLINPDGTGLEQITFFTGFSDSQVKALHFPLFARVWKNSAKQEIAMSRGTKLPRLAGKAGGERVSKTKGGRMHNLKSTNRMTARCPHIPSEQKTTKSPIAPIFSGILSLSALSYVF
ncbi:MAG: TolB family protein, partial [bacterium]